MKLKTVYIGLIFTLLLFLGIGSADALGLWKTESSKVPVKIQQGDFAGAYDPGDIRGSFSLGDISETFDIPVEVLAKAFAISSEDPSNFLLKELESLYEGTAIEIGTGSVRQFVAYYTSLPYESDDGFPSTAVQVLKDEGLWTEQMASQLDGRIIDQVSSLSTSESVVTLDETVVKVDQDEATDEEHEASTSINGNTTVADAIALGLTLSIIEETLGVEVDNQQITIRDLCTNNSLAFSAMKDALNKRLP